MFTKIDNRNGKETNSKDTFYNVDELLNEKNNYLIRIAEIDRILTELQKVGVDTKSLSV